jgi:hypothetical protein
MTTDEQTSQRQTMNGRDLMFPRFRRLEGREDAMLPIDSRPVITLIAWLLVIAGHNAPADVLPPAPDRFASKDVDETPDFQRHIVPLFGRLGCNGRSCHGSFQGRGGFRLSLFGYDFQADYSALTQKQEEMRVDVDDPAQSLILTKPTDEFNHEGGLRYKKNSWQYHLIRRWIESGAPFDKADIQKLVRLEIVPDEIGFEGKDQEVQLRAIARWSDGTREDVTPLCRFRTNDEQVAGIDQNGLVRSNGTGDTHVIVFYDNAVVPVPVLRPVSSQAVAKYPVVPTPTKIDKLVLDKLRKLRIVPSERCSDAEFLRRVRIDMTGSLPTPEEVRNFLADDTPNKRERKIDELLDTPAYAAWWATKLCDFTGNNSEQLQNATPMRGAAAREWYDWIHRRVAENTPYDELVAGIVTAKSRKTDQDYLEFCEEMSSMYRDGDGAGYADLPCLTHYWARRDFRELEARAIGFAYSFLGQRIQCAQCHKHPFDQWTKDDFHQFKNFFSRVVAGRQGASPEGRKQYNLLIQRLGLKGKRGGDLRRMLPQLVEQGKTIPFPEVYLSTKPVPSRNPDGDYPVFEHAKLLGGEVVDVDGSDDPRDALMEWLRDKDNPYFARALVNRVWASYFNVGIVDPPDDLSLANPPSNESLLDYLAKGFIESGFDMKWVHRTIVGSRTYQLSWVPNETNRDDRKNFSHAIPRRLPAEVAYDAVRQATASSDEIAAMHADPARRAIAEAGAGYSYRRTGGSAYALTVFGRSTRDSNCDCDRSTQPSLLQTIYLQNDDEVLRLISQRKGGWIDEVARQFSPHRPNAARPDAAQVARLRKQVAQLQTKVQRLRKAGDVQEAQAMMRRLSVQRKRLAEIAQQSRQTETVEIPEDQFEQIVNDAYLRTLSRYPNESELTRSRQHIAEADNAIDGVRDLLWALLNTKEFIVNR